jgi:tetratricopeptide (TPR) repeat protein
LEDIGERVFRTYHDGATFLISVGEGMEPDSARAQERRIAMAERLAPDAVGEDAEYTHLLVNIASIYRARNDHVRAIAWMERAVRIAPHDANLSLWLADYYSSAQETAKATRCVEAVLLNDPRNLNALMLGAMLASRRQDFTRALAYLERARIVAPEDPDVRSWTEQLQRLESTSREKSVTSHRATPRGY